MQGMCHLSGDPTDEALRLICHLLQIEDLRSARLVSKAWRDTASSTVAAVVVEAANSSQLSQAALAFKGFHKLHVSVASSQLRVPQDDQVGRPDQPAPAEAGTNQQEGFMQDQFSVEAELVEPVQTAKLAFPVSLRPLTLLCIEVTDELNLSLHEHGDLFQQLCQPLEELQSRAALPAVTGIEATCSSQSNCDGTSAGSTSGDIQTSSTQSVSAAASASSRQGTRAYSSATNNSSGTCGTQLPTKPSCELMLKVPWLPSPSTWPATWSQLTSLQTLLLDHSLDGQSVAALADAVPQLTQLSISVKGGDSRLQQISQLQGLKSLHICAINTNHSAVSIGIFGLTQLQHLHISGDLVLQTVEDADVDARVPVHWPRLQTLTLQQPMSPAQLATFMQQQPNDGPLTVAGAQSVLTSSGSNSSSSSPKPTAVHARNLQQLSLWGEDRPDGAPTMTKWCDSSISMLQLFQRAIHSRWQTGVDHLEVNNDSVVTAMVAEAMSQVLKQPSDLATGAWLHSALLRGSSRPRSSSAVPVCSCLQMTAPGYSSSSISKSSRWQQGRHKSDHVGLPRLLVRCGHDCDLSAVLQQCQPQELTVATVPSGAAILQQAGVAVHSHMIASSTLPRPRYLEVTFRAHTDQTLWCLTSLKIDTTHTQAGLRLDSILTRAIARSCPSLVCLQLIGILDISQEAVAALGRGCKGLAALTLVDTRLQTLDYLAKTIAAIADTPEPEQHRQQRLRRLAAAWRRFTGAGVLSGLVLGVWPSYFCTWSLLKSDAFAGIVWIISTMAAMVPHGLEFDASQHWSDQVISMQSLVIAADVYTNSGRVPRIMACWLPSGLRSLHLEKCELCSHPRCLGCRAFAEKMRRDGVEFTVTVVADARIPRRSLRACKQPLLWVRLKYWKGCCTLLCTEVASIVVGCVVGSVARRRLCRGRGSIITRAPHIDCQHR